MLEVAVARRLLCLSLPSNSLHLFSSHVGAAALLCHATLFHPVAVEGGPVSDRESRALAKLKQEAQDDMKKKGLDVAVVIEDMEYLTFMKRYGSGGTVPPPTCL